MTILRDTLPRALSEHPRSPCYDDLRFISADPVDAMEAAEICDGCTFRACIEIARNLPIGQRAEREGTWNGALYINGQRREKRGAA